MGNKRVVVAIQGIKESFHAIAAYSLFSEDIELNECHSFHDVFSAVKDGASDFGVVAIENSLYGSINDTYDLLVKNDLHICGEAYEQIGLYLVGAPDSKLGDITNVYSHPAALGESSDYLDLNLPSASRHEYSDTALAAKFVSESNDNSKAAIAGELAANTYTVNVLAKNIESHKHNYTRFILISKQQAELSSKNAKSTIVFQTGNKPGSLHAALGVFAKYNIGLTKLESRPIVGKAWRYMYYADIESAFNDELQKELSKVASNVRLLGTYQAGSIKGV
jgi:prephenate dehydratase